MMLRDLAVVILMLAAAAPAAAYEPIVPKAGPEPTSVVVVTINPEERNLLGSITALQGLINRQGGEKVYVAGQPSWIFRDPVEVGYPVDFFEQMLDDGLIPVPIERAEVGEGRFATLLYLLERYPEAVEGYAVYEPRGRQTQSIEAAAVNAATFEGALPVSVGVYNTLKNRGHDLPIIADLRGIEDGLAAFEWSLNRYVDHPDLNTKLLAHTPAKGTTDYLVACHIFSFYFKNVNQQGYAEAQAFLQSGTFPPGTPVLGQLEVEGMLEVIRPTALHPIEGYGHNFSITSAFPTDPEQFAPALKPQALPIDPNGVYIAWRAADGDNLGFFHSYTYKGLRNDPAAGSAPVGWTIHPYAVDLHPPLFAWYTQQHRAQIDLIPSLNNGGWPEDDAGRKAWRQMYARNFEAANGAFQTLHLMGLFNNPQQAQWQQPTVGHLEPELVIVGYMNIDDVEPVWGMADQTVYVNHVGEKMASNLATAGGSQAWRNLDKLRLSIELHAEPGKPMFILARVPSEVGMHASDIVRWTIEHLQNDSGISRTIYPVLPRDIAATYKRYQGVAGRAMPLADLTTSTSRDDFWATVRRTAQTTPTSQLIEQLQELGPPAQATTYALGLKERDDAAVAALINVLDKVQAADAVAVAAALAKLATPEDVGAIEPLTQLVADTDHAAANKAAAALMKIVTPSARQAVRPVALTRLREKSTPPQLRRLAAELLAAVRADDAEVVDALAAALAGDAGRAAGAALARTGARGFQRAVALAESSTDPDATRHALLGLANAELGEASTAATAALRRHAQRPDVAKAAALVFLRHGNAPAEAADLLLDRIADTTDVATNAKLIEAFGEMPAARHLPNATKTLIAILDEGTTVPPHDRPNLIDQRKAAAKALGLIAGSDPTIANYLATQLNDFHVGNFAVEGLLLAAPDQYDRLIQSAAHREPLLHMTRLTIRRSSDPQINQLAQAALDRHAER